MGPDRAAQLYRREPRFPLCFEAHMNRLPVENEVLADKYRVERIVGRGGMGIVLSAWHLALDQRVALKCLQPELAQNADSAARFLREARAADKIKSEHGVRVLDVGNLDDG